MDMNDSLKCLYEATKVAKTLSQMHPLKSLGPDAMNTIFCQKFWHIVGDSVTKTVLLFVNKDTF